MTRAIIDIGSNSVRLVVYGAPARAPAILFNEKVTAGLGIGLAASGALDPDAMEVALRGLARFRALTREMGVRETITVATAAVREASNGGEFLGQARSLGLRVELLSGEAEAEAAAFGVISAIPQANGIVADLGGGSLELARVEGGAVGARASFPLGVLRLPALRAQGRRGFERQIGRLLAKAGWADAGVDLPLYLVGGSWRALARLHMHLIDWPLPILHHYALAPHDADRLVRVLAHIERKNLRAIPNIPTARAGALDAAAALLAALVRRLGASAMIVSAAGLREGLLYARLSNRTRREDPLLAAARDASARQSRFAPHGGPLDAWIAPLFDDAGDARLRLAACLLADVAWAANPDFRAERAREIALHGSWTGIDARGRAIVAAALEVSFGGNGGDPVAAALLAPDDRTRATRWGLAMRLGQRLSGGVAGPLVRSRLIVADEALLLDLGGGNALYGDAVERRHKALAQALGLEARLA